MVGHDTLNVVIGVRVPAPQHKYIVRVDLFRASLEQKDWYSWSVETLG